MAESAAAGGARAWFEDQLDPALIDDHEADEIARWWEHLALSPQEKSELAESDPPQVKGFIQEVDCTRWQLIHAMNTRRQLLSIMTDFWANHFYINAPLPKVCAHRFRYDQALREHALGSFDRLLASAVLHPMMLVYLDNDVSHKDALNENLGRELLELHTVGRDLEIPFSEDDVLNSARIISGYGIHPATREAEFHPDLHWVGRVQVMEFSHPNSRSDGREVALAYVQALAEHPATAKRIIRKLAIRFVSDDPSDELLADLFSAFEPSRNITDLLLALVDHDEFRAAAGRKVRTPIEDLVASYRAMQAQIPPPDDGDAAVTVIQVCQDTGQRPYDWPRPDGFPDRGEVWSSPSRMLATWDMHRALSIGGSDLGTGIEMPDDAYWHGPLPATFDTIVDRMCRLLLARPADPELMRIATESADPRAGEIEAGHPEVGGRLPALIGALLDTPHHMTR